MCEKCKAMLAGAEAAGEDMMEIMTTLGQKKVASLMNVSARMHVIHGRNSDSGLEETIRVVPESEFMEVVDKLHAMGKGMIDLLNEHLHQHKLFEIQAEVTGELAWIIKQNGTPAMHKLMDEQQVYLKTEGALVDVEHEQRVASQAAAMAKDDAENAKRNSDAEAHAKAASDQANPGQTGANAFREALKQALAEIPPELKAMLASRIPGNNTQH